MTLKPRISEKAYGQSQAAATYVFEVPVKANKAMIAVAVATQFNVTVTSVNVMNLKGKTVRRFKRRGVASTGIKPAVKKAYVSLKAGDSIAIFANEEDTSDKKSAQKEKQ